uniref:Uncharacterized protein n=1 Tax=Talaromyces marneffei PM1 TaxID=1077442 RepID=A0A093XSY6_TALMA
MPNKNFSALDSAASWIPQVLQNEAVIDMDPKRSLGIREIGVGFRLQAPEKSGSRRTVACNGFVLFDDGDIWNVYLTMPQWQLPVGTISSTLVRER